MAISRSRTAEEGPSPGAESVRSPSEGSSLGYERSRASGGHDERAAPRGHRAFFSGRLDGVVAHQGVSENSSTTCFRV